MFLGQRFCGLVFTRGRHRQGYRCRMVRKELRRACFCHSFPLDVGQLSSVTSDSSSPLVLPVPLVVIATHACLTGQMVWDLLSMCTNPTTEW